MALYRIVMDGEERHVEAPTMIEAIRARMDEYEREFPDEEAITPDEIESAMLLDGEDVIRPAKAEGG